MPVATKKQLEALRTQTAADSLTEVVRRSLAVYDFLWEQKVQGAEIIIRTKNGGEKVFVLL